MKNIEGKRRKEEEDKGKKGMSLCFLSLTYQFIVSQDRLARCVLDDRNGDPQRVLSNYVGYR